MDDIYIREKPPKLGKSPCRKFGSQNISCVAAFHEQLLLFISHVHGVLVDLINIVLYIF